MAKITLSTNGAYQGKEVQAVETAELHRFFGDVTADIAIITLTPAQAFSIAADLMYQAVDAGYCSGWHVQFPERKDEASA